MSLKHVFVFVVVALATASARRRQIGEEGGLLNALTRPFVQLIQSSTRQVLNQFKKVVSSIDTQVGAVRDKVQQVASDIGRNALGDVIENMKLLRSRVQRLSNVVRGSSKAVQALMDNDRVSLGIKAALAPVSLGLAALDGQISGLRLIVNAGSTGPLTDSTSDITEITDEK